MKNYSWIWAILVIGMMVLAAGGLRRPPSEWSAIFIKRGLSEMKSGRLDGAYSEFEKALRIDPSNVTGCVEMARLYLAKGDCRSAQQYYLKIDQSRSAPPAEDYFRLGECYFGWGEKGEGQVYYFNALDVGYDRAIARDPEVSRYYLRRAQLYEVLGEKLKAEKDRRQAASIEAKQGREQL